jgi:hypothetical protein
MTTKKNETVEKNESKNINDMTVTEIKALLYDQIVLSEVTKQNIEVLQTELKTRSESDKKEE